LQCEVENGAMQPPGTLGGCHGFCEIFEKTGGKMR